MNDTPEGAREDDAKSVNVVQINPGGSQSADIPPPNGWTRMTRVFLMVACSLVAVGWWVAWIIGVSDKEPSILGMMFLGGMALTATSGGDKIMTSAIDAYKASKK